LSQDTNIDLENSNKSFDQIKSLKLINFRSHSDFSLSLSGKPLAIIGDNGAGKTNILEAISLLSPGRGIRNSKFSEMVKDDNSMPWGVNFNILSNGKNYEVSSGLRDNQKGRDIKINSKKVSGSSALPEIILLSWLTPSMDQIFNETPSYRRRFIDRLCAVYEKNHTKNIKIYEKLMAERNSSFKSKVLDNVWLDALENQMSDVSIAIAETRLTFISDLNKVLETNLDPVWPRAHLEIYGFVENLVSSWNSGKAKEMLCNEFKNNRERDFFSKRTNEGVHRSDLLVNEKNKKIEAKKCSTGEQKSLLMGIILSHLELVSSFKSRYPVLLLDEVLAHFDKIRRKSFFKQIQEIGSQIIMTGTDISVFEELGDLEIYHLSNKKVTDIR
jgi:DNA replication and repair protein RecF|tara:strand:+ start:704 stop:1861 length:1158 start_codon:yes stop_codon:yes gene_type:complete